MGKVVIWVDGTLKFLSPLVVLLVFTSSVRGFAMSLGLVVGVCQRGWLCVAKAAFGFAALFSILPTAGHAGTMALSGQISVSPTGAATYTVPIVLPPGTAGTAPTLSLDYSSQERGGLLGVGWTLSGLPSITRCPRTMAQDGAIGGINYDANDRFCLDGQRLVAIGGAYGADGTQYRTEVDTFSKVISHGSAGSGPAWFEVHIRSGQVMEFGNTTDSRVLAQGEASTRVWTINKVTDAKGNYFAVTYVIDTANGQFYPLRIDYTGNTAASLSPYSSVQFIYATRPDIILLYQAGSLVLTNGRLTDVKTYVGTTLVADYRLSYQQSGPANRSRLTSIAVCDASSNCLPATNFNWTDASYGFAADQPWGGSNYGVNAGWPDDNAYPRGLADVNGDGLLDLVGFGSTGVRVALNTGSGFSGDQPWSTYFGANTGWTTGNINPRMLVDVNGDGLPDIVGFGSGGVGIALNTGAGFATVQDWSFDFGTNQGWSDNTAYPRTLIDVNGDGLPDILGFGGDGVYVALNTGSSSFGAMTKWNAGFGAAAGWSGTVSNGNPVRGLIIPPSSNPQPRMVIDVNGDGLPDIVGIGSAGARVALNTGTSFAPDQPWGGANFGLNAGYNNDNAFPRMLQDVNGDGLPDLVAFGAGGLRVALNTGTTFSPDQGWGAAGFGANLGWTNSDANPRMLVDVNGDGLPDVVGFASGGVRVSLNTGTSFAGDQPWSAAFGSNAGWTSNQIYPRMIVDVNGDGLPDSVGVGSAGVRASLNTTIGPPDMVASVTSGLGAITTITYAPGTNTSVATKGTGTVFPTLDLVAPMYLVSQLNVSNGVGGTYSSSYSYSGARVDARGRGFLGFAQTTIKDLQTGISDATTYRQDFPYIGLVASTTRTLGAQTLGQSTNTYQLANASGGTTIAPGGAPYRVFLSQNVSSGSDLDGTALPALTTANQYDVYNNATQVVVSTPDGFSKTTTSTYTNDTTNWYLGRLTRASVTSVAP